TVLSGEIGNPSLTSDNSNWIVTGATGALLDGFTITAADGQTEGLTFDGYGAGMLNGFGSSPTVRNVVFTGNHTNGSGAGMANFYGCHPTLINVVFAYNSADANAGAMLNAESDPVLENVVFIGNTSVSGGNDMWSNASDPVLKHVTFGGSSGNSGVFFYSAVTGNMSNVLFWNTSTENLTLPANQGNIVATSDPFVDSADPDGPDDIWLTADDGLRLKATASEVIGQGVSSDLTTDILGESRVDTPESGAYEYLPAD
ncbi:MAG TPA: hypothetical protein V6D23_25725, partial [Candidatus Obscuribacterales bacterium]